MSLRRALAALAGAASLALLAPPVASAPAPAWPLAHLALAQVTVTLRPEAARVTSELSFTRGRYAGGDLEVFVSYGNPGPPRALEASLVPVAAGRLTAAPDAPATPLASRPATQAPAEASLVIGPRAAAGQRLTLTEGALQQALAASGAAALRLRWVHAFAPTSSEHRSVLVRATSAGHTLPLGALRLEAHEGRLLTPSARLCGGAALALIGQAALGPLVSPPRVAASDRDLCFSAALAP